MIEFPMAPSTCFRLLLMLGLYTGFAKGASCSKTISTLVLPRNGCLLGPRSGWRMVGFTLRTWYPTTTATRMLLCMTVIHSGRLHLEPESRPVLTRDPFTGAFIAEGEVYFRTSNIQAAQFGFVGNYYRLYYYRQPENPPFEKPGLGLDRCQNVAGFSCETIAAVVPAIRTRSAGLFDHIDRRGHKGDSRRI